MIMEMPQVFQMEITNQCNFHCTCCPQGRGDYIPNPAKLLLKTIKGWIKRGDFEGTKVISGLHVVGEPTLHPDWFKIIELFGKYGIKVKDATNCYKFKDKLWVKELLGMKNLDTLILSVDACYESTFAKIKGVPKGWLYKITSGIEDYISENEYTKIYIKAMKQDGVSEHELHDLKNYWSLFEEKYDLVKVKIKFLDTWGGQYDWVKTRPTLKEMQGICPEPFRRVVILANGDIVPCCYVYDSKIKYGNLYEDTMDAIWKDSNDKYELMRDMCLGKYDIKPCSNCREWMIPTAVEHFEDRW